MSCVSVDTVLTFWLLHRTQSDPNCRLPGRTKPAAFPVLGVLDRTPGGNQWAPRAALWLWKQPWGKVQRAAHSALNSPGFVSKDLFLTSFSQNWRFNWLFLFAELLWKPLFRQLMNAATVPLSQLPKHKPPGAFLPSKTRGFISPLWNSQCHSQ